MHKWTEERKRGRVPGKQVSLPAAPSYGIVPKGTWFIGWIGISSAQGQSTRVEQQALRASALRQSLAALAPHHP